MLKYLRQIDWLPLVTSALLYILVVDLMSSLGFHQYDGQNDRTNHAAEEGAARSIWPTSPEGWTALFTFTLTVSTIGLWIATYWIVSDARKAAKKRRSIVRGAVLMHRPGQRLTIEASNSGEGAAIINRVSWRITEFGDFTTRAWWRDDPSGEVVHAPERAKPIKVVPLDEAEHFLNPMIVFRFDYTDVNRGITDAFIEHAMFIRDKWTPEEAVFVDVPIGFLGDNFKVEIGS